MNQTLTKANTEDKNISATKNKVAWKQFTSNTQQREPRKQVLLSSTPIDLFCMVCDPTCGLFCMATTACGIAESSNEKLLLCASSLMPITILLLVLKGQVQIPPVSSTKKVPRKKVQ